MRILALITFIFFTGLSLLIYFTKNYQYEKYLIVEKSDQVRLYKINLNLATWQDFSNLPGIGESLAKEIVHDREENGRFDMIGDIKRVSGIGRKKFRAIEKYLTLEI